MRGAGVGRLRAQVEGGASTNAVVPRAMPRDVLRQVEREAGGACLGAWEGGCLGAWEGGRAARAAGGPSGGEAGL